MGARLGSSSSSVRFNRSRGVNGGTFRDTMFPIDKHALRNRTSEHSTCEHKQEGTEREHSISEHNTCQHSTFEHSTSEHTTSEHNTCQHNTTEHSTSEHNMSTQHMSTHLGHRAGVRGLVLVLAKLSNLIKITCSQQGLKRHHTNSLNITTPHQLKNIIISTNSLIRKLRRKEQRAVAEQAHGVCNRQRVEVLELQIRHLK